MSSALQGGLGAGKTTLARAILRAASGDPGLIVPSPTFTLVEVYDTRRGAFWHFDLYRLETPGAGLRAGLGGGAADGIALVEWAERLGLLLPDERLTVTLAMEGDGTARRSAGGRTVWRFLKADRLRADFVRRAGWGDAGERLLAGDASFRKYFRLSRPRASAVVMDAPPPQEDVRPFVRIGRHLIELGLSAPDDPRRSTRTTASCCWRIWATTPSRACWRPAATRPSSTRAPPTCWSCCTAPGARRCCRASAPTPARR